VREIIIKMWEENFGRDRGKKKKKKDVEIFLGK
jgi:hypothetical protein